MTSASYTRQVNAHLAALNKLADSAPRGSTKAKVKAQKAVKAVAPKAPKVEAKAVAPKVERVIVVRDPESPASFRQRKYIAGLSGTFPKGDMTKGYASIVINALLAGETPPDPTPVVTAAVEVSEPVAA